MINFGTGGWRAIIGDDFIRENIQKLPFPVVPDVPCIVVIFHGVHHDLFFVQLLLGVVDDQNTQ